MKTCSYCGEDKALTEFRRRSRGRKGFRSNCKDCGNLVAQLSRYGLSREDYESLLSSQNGRCAICYRADKKLCIDHDHKTDRVRGLLCYSCNNHLSYFERFQGQIEEYLNG